MKNAIKTLETLKPGDPVSYADRDLVTRTGVVKATGRNMAEIVNDHDGKHDLVSLDAVIPASPIPAPSGVKTAPSGASVAPFDLAKALAGHPLIGGDGIPALNFRRNTDTSDPVFRGFMAEDPTYPIGQQTFFYSEAGSFGKRWTGGPYDLFLDLSKPWNPPGETKPETGTRYHAVSVESFASPAELRAKFPSTEFTWTARTVMTERLTKGGKEP